MFGQTSAPSRPTLSFGWLAPVAACLLLAVSLFNQRGVRALSASDNSHHLVAVILSNQSYAPYLPGSFQRAQNGPDTFEWTRGGASTSSKRSLLPVGPAE